MDMVSVYSPDTLSGVGAAEVPSMVELREWRARLRVSQERVAARLGISPRTLGRWERDEYDPGEINRRRLAGAYQEAETNPEAWAA